MKLLSINYLIVLLLPVSYAYTMEKDWGYKVIETVHIPQALTLATNVSTIAVGTACGSVKLYDNKGKSKGNIPYCGDGGLLFIDDYGLIGVSRNGQVFNHVLGLSVVDRVYDTGATTYSIAHSKNQLFVGSDSDTVHAWNNGKCVWNRTYTGADECHINALQVTDKAILRASSGGCLKAIDRETGALIWVQHQRHNPLVGLAKKNSLCYVGYKNGLLLIGNVDGYMHDSVIFKKYIYSLACLKSCYLVVGTIGSIEIYDVRKFVTPLIELKLQNKENIVAELEATENGFVAIVDHNTMHVWQEVQ